MHATGRDFFVEGGAGRGLRARLLPAVHVGPFNARTRIELTQVTLALPRLPAAFAGFRIALVSDLHYGRSVQAAFIRKVARIVVEQAPDLVLLAGDWVEHFAPRFVDLAELLSEVVRRFPTCAVPGNHDYFGRPEPLWQALREAGVDILVNRHRLIRRGDAAIAVVGVDDVDGGHPDIRQAVAGIGAGTFTILASHSPDAADLVPDDVAIDVLLAGHTHGGQIQFFGWAPMTYTRNRRYLQGLYQQGRFPLYVCRGLGATFLPIRIGSPSELPIITLCR